MRSQESNEFAEARRQRLVAVAWIGTLLVSSLPDIIWREAFSGEASQALWARSVTLVILWARPVTLVILLALTLAWKSLRRLSGYFLLLLVIHMVAGIVSPLIEESRIWQGWFGSEQASWAWSSLGVHLLRLLVPLVTLAVLSLMGLSRRDYFLVKGQLDAPVEPVRWLGINQPDPWTHFGRVLAIIVTLVTLVFLVIGARPSGSDVVRALPLLPVVVLFAALNAFNEELPYRAALLSQLLPAVGKQHALLLTAVLFGLGHFYGVPSGLSGVLMAGFFAWLMGKSMVETRGFFWAWFIHFLQDVVIFFLFAISSCSLWEQ